MKKTIKKDMKLENVQTTINKVQTNIDIKDLMAKLETPAGPSNPTRYTGVSCPLRVGSDCAGLMSESVALDNMGLKHTSIFIAESEPTLAKLLQLRHPCAKFTADLTGRDDDKDTDHVDLYIFGAPCQPWSPAGKQQGNKDKKKRNIVMWKCIDYIRTKLPRTVIGENSHAFAFKKFKKVRRKIISLIKSYGYKVWWKILNTMDYGIPQHRKRFYFVAIKTEAIKREFKFPSKSPCLPLNSVLVAPGVPGRPRLPSTKRAKHVKKRALKKMEAKGIIPRPRSPVIIDVNASERFTSCMAKVSPTLTASRCTQNGHYVALRKGMMRIEEMCRLQCVHPRFITDSLVLLKQNHGDGEASALRVLKHAIGNAMSVNVLMVILSKLLPCAGLANELDRPSLDDLRRFINIPMHDPDLSEDDDDDLFHMCELQGC